MQHGDSYLGLGPSAPAVARKSVSTSSGRVSKPTWKATDNNNQITQEPNEALMRKRGRPRKNAPKESTEALIVHLKELLKANNGSQNSEDTADVLLAQKG